jgi:hypothetical protein
MLPAWIVQIFGRHDGEAIGDQPCAVERLHQVIAERAVIRPCGPAFGFELDPAKAGAALGADGGALFMRRTMR